jgi:hypothetical protein
MGKESHRKRLQRKPPRQFTFAVGAEEHLLFYRMPKSLPPAELIPAMFALYKFGWLENARLLAKDGSTGYLVLLAFLDRSSVGRVRENLCAISRSASRSAPRHCRRGLRTLGLVFPQWS